MSDHSEIEWTDASCRPCGAGLTESNRVESGRQLCKSCKNEAQRMRYVAKGPPVRFGPAPYPPRDGDRRHARQRINVEVRTGRRPHPNTLPCVDCGHLYGVNSQHRHEYDHFLGYGAAHHYDVEPVCSTCHHRRAERRGETFYARSA